MDRFEELQTFVAVVETGNFSSAAERLNLAKSAVSRRIGELEARLDVQLLNRTTRRLSLTDAGHRFYELSVRLLGDLDEAEQAIASGRAALTGRIRLAAPLSFGLLHLEPALSEFLHSHPDVDLDLDLSDRQINLVEEGFDLAIRIGELSDSTLVAKRLAPIHFVNCASPEYLRRNGTPATPQELVNHHGLAYGYISAGQQWSFIGDDGSSTTVKVRTRLRANNGDALQQAAIAGLGVLVSPTFISYNAIATGQLVPIMPHYRMASMAAFAIYPSRRHLPQRVRMLIDFLAERFGDEPYWDQEMAQALNHE